MPSSKNRSAYFSRRQKKQDLAAKTVDSVRIAHEKLSYLIKNIFYIYIFANLFSLVTLYTTSDAQLIESSGLLRIPIFGIKVPFVFFVASASMFLIALFVYLSIRFEELDKLDGIEPRHKTPYIFNSQQKAAVQLSNFLLYFLGPITLFVLWEKAYLFKELDRLSAVFGFFVMLSFLAYKKRSQRHVLMGILVFLSLGCFIYFASNPLPLRFLENTLDVAGKDLKRIDMSAYRLNKAVLNHSQLFEAQIRNTDFQEAQLWGANFTRASIYHSNFIYCDIEYADFSKTIIRDVSFSGSKLKHTNFNDTVLFNLSFDAYRPPSGSDNFAKPPIPTNLSYTKFNNAKLVAIKFDNANLNHAEFQNSDLQETSFVNANLNYVNFESTTGLTCEQLQQAKSYRLIDLPYYLRKCELPPRTESKVSKTNSKQKKGKSVVSKK